MEKVPTHNSHPHFLWDGWLIAGRCCACVPQPQPYLEVQPWHPDVPQDPQIWKSPRFGRFGFAFAKHIERFEETHLMKEIPLVPSLLEGPTSILWLVWSVQLILSNLIRYWYFYQYFISSHSQRAFEKICRGIPPFQNTFRMNESSSMVRTCCPSTSAQRWTTSHIFIEYRSHLDEQHYAEIHDEYHCKWMMVWIQQQVDDGARPNFQRPDHESGGDDRYSRIWNYYSDLYDYPERVARPSGLLSRACNVSM